jgi:hypothetical protein
VSALGDGPGSFARPFNAAIISRLILCCASMTALPCDMAQQGNARAELKVID